MHTNPAPVAPVHLLQRLIFVQSARDIIKETNITIDSDNTEIFEVQTKLYTSL